MNPRVPPFSDGTGHVRRSSKDALRAISWHLAPAKVSPRQMGLPPTNSTNWTHPLTSPVATICTLVAHSAWRKAQSLQRVLPTIIQNAENLSRSKPETSAGRLCKQIRLLRWTNCLRTTRRSIIHHATTSFQPASTALTFLTVPKFPIHINQISRQIARNTTKQFREIIATRFHRRRVSTWTTLWAGIQTLDRRVWICLRVTGIACVSRFLY